VKLQRENLEYEHRKNPGWNHVSEYVHSKTKEVTMFLNNFLSIHRRIFGAAAVIGLLTAGTGGPYGFQSQVQWSDKILFTVVDQARSAALEENADILAPRAFAKATERVNKAQSSYLKGERLSEVRKQLRLATTEFNKAATNARVAQAVLASMMQARFDAIRAEAPVFAKEKWDQAENILKKAAQTLEDGTMKEARRSATEAERLYRESELLAIKENILKSTYELLQDAERLKVKQDAPKTLMRAQNLVKEAETQGEPRRYGCGQKPGPAGPARGPTRRLSGNDYPNRQGKSINLGRRISGFRSTLEKNSRGIGYHAFLRGRFHKGHRGNHYKGR
jgi:hypothetical protein